MSNITKEDAVKAAETVLAYLQQEGGEDAPAAEVVTIPSADEISDVKQFGKDAVLELASKLGIETEGKKSTELRPLLVTLAKIKDDADLDDEDDVNALAEALGLTPDKKQAKTIAALKEWAEALGAGGEESTEETTEEESTEEDGASEESTEESAEEATEEESTEEESTEEESTEGEASEESAEESTEESTEGEGEENSDADNVDREAIAAKIKKFPDSKIMSNHLTAYNKVAKTKIKFDPKKPQEGYRKLLAELVASDETVTAWGVPYIRDSAGWSCGLPLADIKLKGHSRPCGKCSITGKVYELNEDSDGFDEVKK